MSRQSRGRTRGSKQHRKQLRHKSNQIAGLKQASSQLLAEYWKTMAWLLAALETQGPITVPAATLAATQQRLPTLGWQAVPTLTNGVATQWTLRMLDRAAEQAHAEPDMAGANVNGDAGGVAPAGSATEG